MPKVSVLMTVYNGMPFLPPAVESVLGQTFQDFDFVIVNDGSTDGTADYLASLDDPRIRVITQENGGTAAAANHGLQHCHGQLLARMDADDISLPQRFEKQVAFLDSHPQVGLVGTQMAPMGPNKVGKSLHLPLTHQEIYPSMRKGYHGLAHSAIMMRTDLLKQIGGYWSFRLIDDWDMMLRMGEVAELANIDEVLHHYRVHGGSLNGQAMRRMRSHIAFACELADRREAQAPAISYDEFMEQQKKRPAYIRLKDAMLSYSLHHYRVAVADIYGSHPVKGYLRMGWAAACNPWWTVRRVARTIGLAGH